MIVLHFDSTHDSWFILTSCCIKYSLSLDMTFSFLFGAIRAKYSCLLYKVNYGGYVLSQTMNISFSSLKFTDQSDNGRLQDNMKRLFFFFDSKMQNLLLLSPVDYTSAWVSGWNMMFVDQSLGMLSFELVLSALTPVLQVCSSYDPVVWGTIPWSS